MSTDGNVGLKSSAGEESGDKPTLTRADTVRVSGRRRGSVPRPSLPPPPPPPGGTARQASRDGTPPPERAASPAGTPPRKVTPPPPRKTTPPVPPTKPPKASTRGPPTVAPKPVLPHKPSRKNSSDKLGVTVSSTGVSDAVVTETKSSVSLSDTKQSECVSAVHVQSVISHSNLSTESKTDNLQHSQSVKDKSNVLRGKARSFDDEPPRPPRRTSSLGKRSDITLSVAGEIRLDKSNCEKSRSVTNLAKSSGNDDVDSVSQSRLIARVSTAGRTPPIVNIGKAREVSPLRNTGNDSLDTTPTSSDPSKIHRDRVNGKPPTPTRTSSISWRSTATAQNSTDADAVQGSPTKLLSNEEAGMADDGHTASDVGSQVPAQECQPSAPVCETLDTNVKNSPPQRKVSNPDVQSRPKDIAVRGTSKPALRLLRQKRTEVTSTVAESSTAKRTTMRQSSAFTTEDLDLCAKPRTRGDDISRSMTKVGQASLPRPSGAALEKLKQKRRRSKSVGIIIPPNLNTFPSFAVANIGRASSKPKVPTKPKFNDKLISGKGLPSVAPPWASNDSINSSSASLSSSSSSLTAASVSTSALSQHPTTSSVVSTAQVTVISQTSLSSSPSQSSTLNAASDVHISEADISETSAADASKSAVETVPDVPAKLNKKLRESIQRYTTTGGGTGSDSHTDSDATVAVDPLRPPRRKKAVHKRERGSGGSGPEVARSGSMAKGKMRSGSFPSLNKCNSIPSMDKSDSEPSGVKPAKSQIKKRKSSRKSSASMKSRTNSSVSATRFYISEDKSLEKEVKVGGAMFYGTDAVGGTDDAATEGSGEVYENVQRNSQIYGGIEIRKNEAGRNDLDDKKKLESVVPREVSIGFRHHVPSSSSGTDVEDHIYDNSTPKILMTRQSKDGKFESAYENVEFFGGQAFYDSDSDFDDDSFSDTEVNEHIETTEAMPTSHEPKDKVEQIANELLTTERAYVKRLHLVDQKFQFRVLVENRASRMFPDDVIPQMFSNIKSIFQFHHDFLLPQLEKRMENWATTPKVGDLMKKFAPFLKLYSDYVSNFDHAMNEITCWTMKCPRFAAIMAEIQKTPECGSLTLQHHMLEPIQRVPRYKLLLTEYLKRLPEDSEDRADSEVALKLVAKAAEHSNDAMRKNEKFRKLLEINERFGGMVDLISPTRELVKEGKITKISARNGYQHERYLFLFNDLLLLCQNMPIGIKQTYRIKARLELDGMQVLEGDNLETPDTFIIKSKQKTLELHCNSSDEKLNWQVSLWNVIKDYTRKELSRRQCLEVTGEFQEQELGVRAPQWVKDQETCMCMQCATPFSAFRRRHHCRACGIVVCAKCSSQKASLAYENYKLRRVCDKCYVKLAEQGATGPQIIRTPTEVQSIRIKPVLKVKASDPAVIASYLHMSSNKTTWSKRWFAIHEDLVLYSFKAHQDVVAMTSLPLPSYKVEVLEKGEGQPQDNVFQLSHSHQKSYYLQADDKALLDRWVGVLEKVVQAELPEDYVSKKQSDA